MTGNLFSSLTISNICQIFEYTKCACIDQSDYSSLCVFAFKSVGHWRYVGCKYEPWHDLKRDVVRCQKLKKLDNNNNNKFKTIQ